MKKLLKTVVHEGVEVFIYEDKSVAVYGAESGEVYRASYTAINGQDPPKVQVERLLRRDKDDYLLQ